MMPRRCGWSPQRARQVDDLLHEAVQPDVRQLQLRLAWSVEFAHARYRLGHIVDGALDGDQAIACAWTQAGFSLQH
jgi:hypothetical protein